MRKIHAVMTTHTIGIANVVVYRGGYWWHRCVTTNCGVVCPIVVAGCVGILPGNGVIRIERIRGVARSRARVVSPEILSRWIVARLNTVARHAIAHLSKESIDIVRRPRARKRRRGLKVHVDLSKVGRRPGTVAGQQVVPERVAHARRRRSTGYRIITIDIITFDIARQKRRRRRRINELPRQTHRCRRD